MTGQRPLCCAERDVWFRRRCRRFRIVDPSRNSLLAVSLVYRMWARLDFRPGSDHPLHHPPLHRAALRNCMKRAQSSKLRHSVLQNQLRLDDFARASPSCGYRLPSDVTGVGYVAAQQDAAFTTAFALFLARARALVERTTGRIRRGAGIEYSRQG